MPYRSEIDGLRAVAVIPVILFHAGLQALPGGFVGVDVFFVISGYLITSRILDERARGTFSYRGFYERRVRRIVPALFAMLAVSTVVAWIFLLPVSFRHYGISAAAVALFASNFYFLRTTDYFAAPAELVPLIHTWSLGIEEQFYLASPALAVFASARKRAIVCVVSLMGLSLALAQWASIANPAAGFYLLPTRAWELLAGCLVAYYAPSRVATRSFLREVLAITGLAGLAASYLIYDRDTPFPSLYAALPVAGTAFVIAFATAETWIGKLLSWRPLTFIGLISYSTYLWHQPLLAFARHISLDEPPAYAFALLSVAAFALGAASYKLIELPFRDRSWLTQRQVFAMAGAGSALLIAFGVASIATGGFRARFDGSVLALAEPRESWTSTPCHRIGPTYAAIEHSCILGEPRNIVGALIGDSHAASIASELDTSLRKAGFGLLQLTFNGCPTIPDVYRIDLSRDYDCAGFNEKVRRFLESSPSLTQVLVVSRWTGYLSLAGFNNGEGGVEHTNLPVGHLKDGKPWPLPDNERLALIGSKLIMSARSLLDMGKGVTLVYPIPEVGWDAPSYLARRELQRRFTGAEVAVGSTSFEAFQTRNRTSFEILDAIGTHPRLARVYPHTAFCNTALPGRCLFEQGGQSLYTESNHVSLAGARLMAPTIVQAISRQMQGP